VHGVVAPLVSSLSLCAQFCVSSVAFRLQCSYAFARSGPCCWGTALHWMVPLILVAVGSLVLFGTAVLLLLHPIHLFTIFHLFFSRVYSVCEGLVLWLGNMLEMFRVFCLYLVNVILMKIIFQYITNWWLYKITVTAIKRRYVH
jgi:hypothetical protein